VPDVMILRGFHKDNSVIKLANNIFDEVLICNLDDAYIVQESIFTSIEWYQNNQTILRLFDVLKRFIKKYSPFYSLKRLPSLLFNRIHKGEKQKNYFTKVNNVDILLYDIGSENNHKVSDVLYFFRNNKKYSLPHALAMVNDCGEAALGKIDNVTIYIYADFQKIYYETRYGIGVDKMHVVGMPRHDPAWIKTIQDESHKLPDNFDNNNSVVILSRHVHSEHCSFDEKFHSIKNIKKLFIDKLKMKLVIKLHPNEKRERIYPSKEEKVYENILGLDNYGSTWIYSDLHVLALAESKKLAISLNTGVIFDVIALGVPCIEYLDSFTELEKSKKYKRKFTTFEEYGFIEKVSNYHELCDFTDRWIKNPKSISTLSRDKYGEYFPRFNNISNKMAGEILNKNKSFL